MIHTTLPRSRSLSQLILKSWLFTYLKCLLITYHASVVTSLAVDNTAGSVSHSVYDTVKDPSSMSRLVCAQTVPSDVAVGRSSIDCSIQCKQMSCLGFNVVSSNATDSHAPLVICQMFLYLPNMFEVQGECTYYEVC